MPARGKTIMFVDNSNIFHGSRQAGWRIDAKKLHTKLEADGPIWQTFFFAAVSDPPGCRFASPCEPTGGVPHPRPPTASSTSPCVARHRTFPRP